MKALVTGASSGMGRDMAKYLYSLGYELYLVARNKKDLNREFKGYKNIHTYGYNLIIEEECVKLYKELKNLPYNFGASIGHSMIDSDKKLIEDALNEAVEDMKKTKQENSAKE